MKPFYTGPIENAELLAVMIGNHGFECRREKVDPSLPEDDLNQEVRVFVREEDYDQVHNLFHGDTMEY